MIRRPPRSTPLYSSAASDVYKRQKFSKSNLYNWMNLTKKERFDLSKNESNSYLKKRKTLLEEIRKEYKSISKND